MVIQLVSFPIYEGFLSQKEENQRIEEIVSRLNKQADLKKRFEEVLRLTDVVLNPTHTQWVGRFREPFISRLLTFSEKKRFCFTCTQLFEDIKIKIVDSFEGIKK